MTRKSLTLDDLKGHYALSYANRAVLCLNDTSKGPAMVRTVGYSEYEFLWAVNSIVITFLFPAV